MTNENAHAAHCRMASLTIIVKRKGSTKKEAKKATSACLHTSESKASPVGCRQLSRGRQRNAVNRQDKCHPRCYFTTGRDICHRRFMRYTLVLPPGNRLSGVWVILGYPLALRLGVEVWAISSLSAPGAEYRRLSRIARCRLLKTAIHEMCVHPFVTLYMMLSI